MGRRGERLLARSQYLMPGHAVSRLAWHLSRVRTPWIKNPLNRWFAAHFGLDLSEAEQADPTAYPSLDALFTRALRPGARPLPDDPHLLVSPADGVLSEFGTARADRLLQAKGIDYSLTALLGGDAALAAPFRDGAFATVYLSPRDYHRFHMPLDGRVTHMIHVPGRLFSVSLATARHIPGLFARNERVVCLFDTPAGRMAVVLVGAVNVAAIETAWAGLVTPPRRHDISVTRYGADGPRLRRGDELGRFHMGSTVIVIMERGRLTWLPTVQTGMTVRVGQALGRVRPPARPE